MSIKQYVSNVVGGLALAAGIVGVLLIATWEPKERYRSETPDYRCKIARGLELTDHSRPSHVLGVEADAKVPLVRPQRVRGTYNLQNSGIYVSEPGAAGDELRISPLLVIRDCVKALPNFKELRDSSRAR